MVLRKETPSAGRITFPIVKVIGETNRRNTISSEIIDELSDFKNDIVTIQRTSKSGSIVTIQWTRKSCSIRDTTNKRPDRWQREQTGGGRVSKKPIFLPG